MSENDENEGQSSIIDPDGPERKRRRKQAVNEDAAAVVEAAKLQTDSEQQVVEAKNREGMTRIDFETMGRFDTPPWHYFKNYHVKSVNDLTLARRDDLMETLVAILNDCADRSEPGSEAFSVEEMLLEEMFELEVSLKYSFYGERHLHRWMCSCQDDVEDDARVLSEQEINLGQLTHISVEEADKKIQDHYKEIFAKMTDKQFEEYLVTRHGSVGEQTRQSEIESFSIQDKIVVKCPVTNKIYEFRFTRIKDIIQGKRKADREFAGKIAQAKRVKWSKQSPLEEWKETQKHNQSLLDHEKAKATVLYGRALSLLKVNGKELTEEEKIHEFGNMDLIAANSYIGFNEKVKFGIQDERDFICNLCGKKERGWLQQRSNPFEFLPLDTDTSRKLGESPTANVFFGI